MKKTLPVFLLLSILLATACTPQVTSNPMPPVSNEPTTSVATKTPIPVTPTPADTPVTPQEYSNSSFGISFQFPFDWFGPDEYISGQTLRVEVGSDFVYPYGNPPETPRVVNNSYHVVIQYMKNNQNLFWKDTYQSLQNLKDGESVSDARSLIIKVKQLDIGRFKGFEYIFTIPEMAQTDHVYGREVMLLDGQTNDLLTITGQPNNVEVSSGAEWREVYQTIDEANLISFDEIVESLTINN